MDTLSKVSARLYKEDEKDNVVRLLVSNLTIEPKKFEDIVRSLSRSMMGSAFYIASDINRRLGIINCFTCSYERADNNARTGSITMLLNPEFLVEYAMYEDVEITTRLIEIEGEYTISASTEDDHWWKQFII